MILHGSNITYETSIVDNQLVRDVRKILKTKKVGWLHHSFDITVLKDGLMYELGAITYFEMIVCRGNEYACIVYEKGGNAAPPDVMTAYPGQEPYVRKVFVV